MVLERNARRTSVVFMVFKSRTARQGFFATEDTENTESGRSSSPLRLKKKQMTSGFTSNLKCDRINHYPNENYSQLDLI